MGRKVSECRAALESEDAASRLQGTGEDRCGSVVFTEEIDPAAGVMARARAQGRLRNVREPRGRSWRSQRRARRRSGRESDRPIVPKKPLIPAEGRGLTSGVLAEKTTVRGDGR